MAARVIARNYVLSSMDYSLDEVDWRSYLPSDEDEYSAHSTTLSFFQRRRSSLHISSITSSITSLKKSITKKRNGPLTKTFSYIRSKVDSAISTSSLYPTKDDVRQWEKSFDALLNHKYGQMLFSQFLNKEFCAENIEFWIACEAFKKMKDGKKSTTEKANEIYRKFVAEGAHREVNLDSDTRAATKAAMESGCRTDTFTLAQGKIEHLLATDKYRRFLKDKIYLDMLNHAEGKSEETFEHGGASK